MVKSDGDSHHCTDRSHPFPRRLVTCRQGKSAVSVPVGSVWALESGLWLLVWVLGLWLLVWVLESGLWLLVWLLESGSTSWLLESGSMSWLLESGSTSWLLGLASQSALKSLPERATIDLWTSSAELMSESGTCLKLPWTDS